MLDALLSGKPVPELVEVARNFMQMVGGPRAFAKLLHDELQNAPVGGMVRAKILDLILQCLKFTTPKDKITDDVGILEDEDLEREYKKGLKLLEHHEESA